MEVGTVQGYFEDLLNVYASSTNAAELETEYQRILEAMKTMNVTQISRLLMENELIGTVVVDTVRLDVCQQSPASWSAAADILCRFLRTNIADVSTELLVQECFQALGEVLNNRSKYAISQTALVCASAMQLLHNLHLDKQTIIFMCPTDAMQYSEYLPGVFSVVAESRSSVTIEKVEQTMKPYLRRLLQQATSIVGNTISNLIDSIANAVPERTLQMESVDVVELQKYVPFGKGDGIVSALCSSRHITCFPRTLDVLLRCFATVCAYPICRVRASFNGSTSSSEDTSLLTLYLNTIESGQNECMTYLCNLLKNLQENSELSKLVDTFRGSFMMLLAPISVCYHIPAQNSAKSLMYTIIQQTASSHSGANSMFSRRNVLIPKHVTLLDIFLTSQHAKMTDLQSFFEGLQCALESFSDMVPDSFSQVQSRIEMLMLDINESILLLLQKLGTISALETIYKTLIETGEKLLRTIPDSCRAMLSRDTCTRLQSFHHFKLQTAVKRFLPSADSAEVSRMATEYPIARAMQVQQVEVRQSSTTGQKPQIPSKSTAVPKRSVLDMMLDQLVDEERRSGSLESEQEAKRRKLYQQEYRPPTRLPPPPPPPPSHQVPNRIIPSMHLSAAVTNSSSKISAPSANSSISSSSSSSSSGASSVMRYLLPLAAKPPQTLEPATKNAGLYSSTISGDIVDLTGDHQTHRNRANTSQQHSTLVTGNSYLNERGKLQTADARFPAHFPPQPNASASSSEKPASSAVVSAERNSSENRTLIKPSILLSKSSMIRRQRSFVDDDDEGDFDDYESWNRKKREKVEQLEMKKRAEEAEKQRNGDASSQKNFALHSFLSSATPTARKIGEIDSNASVDGKVSDETRRRFEEYQQQPHHRSSADSIPKNKQNLYSAEFLTQVSMDQLCAGILRMKLDKIVSAVTAADSNNQKSEFASLPIRFGTQDRYIEAFQPLLIEEFKTALGQFFLQHNSDGGDNASSLQVFHMMCSQLQKRGNYASETDSGEADEHSQDRNGRLHEALVSKDLRYYQQQQLLPKSTNTEGTKREENSTQYQDLQKDDLVMILPRSVQIRSEMTMKDLVSMKDYCLGIVASTAPKRSDFASFTGAIDGNKKQAILVDIEKIPASNDNNTTHYWKVIPIMNISTFLREWIALHSIRDHRLMPLAPYLLKASPVVSQAHLLTIKDDIERRLQNWIEEHRYEEMKKQIPGATVDPKLVSQKRQMENRYRQQNQKQSVANVVGASDDSTSSMKERLEDSLYQLITSDLSAIRIDTSILKNSDIVRTLRRVMKTPQMAMKIISAGQELITKWHKICSDDISPDHIRNLKGGKVIPIPHKEDVALTQAPRTVNDGLWQLLYHRYNNSQLFAIKYVVEAFNFSQDTRVCLVQGPPGTGKTSTIIGMVSALLGRIPHSPHAEGAGASASTALASPARTTAELRRAISEDSSSPRLLICAPSNAAIDEILLRLYQQGIYTYQASSNQASIDTTPKSRIPKIVRLGDVITENHSAQSSQIIQSLTLTYQVDQALLEDPLWQERQALLAAIRDAELQLTEGKRNNATTTNGFKPSNHSSHGNSNQTQQESTLKATQAGLQRLKVQLNRNLMAIEKRKTELRLQILFEAEVVGSTLSSSGKQHFLDYIIKENVLFHTTIIDEAAQTTEPASLIPLRFGCRRLVLVGDPRQLPATVLSRSAERAGLGRSLFERLEQAEHEVVMLTVQYRMHPDIRKFPSLYFYQNLLIDAPHIQQETTLRAILLQQRQIQERNLLMDVDVKEDGEIADEDEEGEEEVHASHCTMTVTTRLITEQSTLFAHDHDCHHSTDGTAAAAAAAAAAPSAVRVSPNRPLASVTFYHIGVDPKSQVGETTSGTSFVNEGEARAMLAWLGQLPRAILEEDDISLAIIVPYKAQVRLLRRMLHRDAQLNYLLGNHQASTSTSRGPHRANSNQTSNPHRGGGASNLKNSVGGRIEVNTVDGFQGREKDIVLYGTVRSKAQHTAHSATWTRRHEPVQPRGAVHGGGPGQLSGVSAIGFVSDERRINVALTRAKKMLVIFGNVYTLAHDEIWRALIVDIEQRGYLHR